MRNDANHINRSNYDNRCTSRIGSHVVSAWIFSREGEEEMTEKVKLTREQIMVLEHFKQNNFGVEDFVLGREHWNNTYTPLKDIPIDAFARIMYEPDSYEVEEEYKVGDWVVHENGEVIRKISKVDKRGVEVEDAVGDHYVWIKGYIRHATPEEIKAEQERRVWAGIGREPGEFRDGDIIFGDPNSNFGLAITKVVDGWSEKAARSDYYDGHIKGFYPAESFVEFGGGEE